MDGPLLGQRDWATSPQVANLTIGIALLGLVVIVAILIVVWIRKNLQSDQEVLTPNDLLTDFRRLREQGVMSEAEFNRIRGLLANKLREEAGQSPVDLANLPPLEVGESQQPEEFQPAESEYEWEDIDLHTFEDDKSTPPGSEKSS